MKHCLMVCALAIGLLATAHYAVAQALTPAQLALKAKVEGVPEIPYEECRISSSCRTACISARASEWRPTPKDTLSYTTAAIRRAFLNLTRPESSCTSLVQGLYGLVFAHA